ATDLTALYPQEKAIRDAAAYVIHTIYDIRGIKRIPLGVISTRHGSPTLEHKNSGQIALVGAQTITKTLAETIIRLSHVTKARFFDTKEEALDYLRQISAAEIQSPSPVTSTG